MRIFIANNVPRLSVSGLFFYFVGKGIEKWRGKHPADSNNQPQKHKHHQDYPSSRCTFFCRHHHRIHPVSYTHLDVYKRQIGKQVVYLLFHKICLLMKHLQCTRSFIQAIRRVVLLLLILFNQKKNFINIRV